MSVAWIFTASIKWRGKIYHPGDLARMPAPERNQIADSVIKVPDNDKLRRFLNRSEDLREIPVEQINSIRIESLQYRFSYQFSIPYDTVIKWSRAELEEQITRRNQCHTAQKPTSKNFYPKVCSLTSLTTLPEQRRSTRSIWVKP